MSMRWSLSDQALAQLLQKLEQYQPITIGIDIYRDFSVDPDYPNLATRLQQDKRLIAFVLSPTLRHSTDVCQELWGMAVGTLFD